MAASYSPALHCSTIGAGGLNFSVRKGRLLMSRRGTMCYYNSFWGQYLSVAPHTQVSVPVTIAIWVKTTHEACPRERYFCLTIHLQTVWLVVAR